ncbi:MAG: family 10 glycosylhydrolase [Anaerolineales bacterium]|nr:family 10 glycosylhydrolase [Anaerolineales bacterium]
MKWYENPRIFFDWVNYGIDLDEEYARWIIEKALKVHADSVAFCAVVGGYALWESTVTPRYPLMGEMDLIGEVARQCKKNGLRFIPWWLATATGGVRRVLEEHPSWQEVGPPKNGMPGEKYNYVCYNSPYRELIYEEVREVVTGYEVDGIYFDQLPISCYCPWCKAKFEKRYDQHMPIQTDEFLVYITPAGLPPVLREFRDDSVKSFCAGIREILDQTKPDVCYAQNWVPSYQAQLVRGLADVVLPEFYQEKDLIPLGIRHRLTKTYFDHGPIWGNVRHGVRHDARHFPVRGTKMLLVDCIANHAAPLMLDLCAIDYDETGLEDLAETFDHMKDMLSIQAETEPVYYAALLHSMHSHEFDRFRYEDAFDGMYRLLFENHVPFEVVNEAGIQRGELERYKVLVIPDAPVLADDTVTQIRKAVEVGLGLVTTFMTGFFDEKGQRRPQPAFADLHGYEMDDITVFNTPTGIAVDPILGIGDIDGEIFHYGSLREGKSITEGIDHETLFSFLGGFAICSPLNGTEVIADIHAIDQVKLNYPIYNRRGHYPGPARWPLAIIQELPTARTAYFALQADAEWRRAYAPELDQLMIHSVLWAGDPPPLEAVDCPRSVEVRLFHNEGRSVFHMMLVNLTTNPLIRPNDVNPGVVRYVTPHKGLEFSLRTDKKVKSVKSLIGSDVSFQQNDDVILIQLPLLDLYDSILVEVS